MRDVILGELEKIEREHDVKIIMACESGSRAWGFPSQDSDYDVRFIYVNRPEWYLSIGERRDVIEVPVNGLLDINGWDIRKSLRLMRKSNVALSEWMVSPIRYRILQRHYDRLRKLSEIAFMPESACHHYLSMARASIAKYGTDDRVNLPDVYRVGYGLGRKGGVKTVARK